MLTAQVLNDRLMWPVSFIVQNQEEIYREFK